MSSDPRRINARQNFMWNLRRMLLRPFVHRQACERCHMKPIDVRRMNNMADVDVMVLMGRQCLELVTQNPQLAHDTGWVLWKSERGDPAKIEEAYWRRARSSAPTWPPPMPPPVEPPPPPGDWSRGAGPDGKPIPPMR